MSSLESLFRICRRPNCGSSVDTENMKIVKDGAMIRIHTLCNNNHSETWDSSPSVGTGNSAIAEINIKLATYILLTGLHIKQVAYPFIKFGYTLHGHIIRFWLSSLT